jgi:hypothetical protein
MPIDPNWLEKATEDALKRLNPAKPKPIGDSRINPLKNFPLGSQEVKDAQEDRGGASRFLTDFWKGF